VNAQAPLMNFLRKPNTLLTGVAAITARRDKPKSLESAGERSDGRTNSTQLAFSPTIEARFDRRDLAFARDASDRVGD
jgi:hypothetical protein